MSIYWVHSENNDFPPAYGMSEAQYPILELHQTEGWPGLLKFVRTENKQTSPLPCHICRHVHLDIARDLIRQALADVGNALVDWCEDGEDHINLVLVGVSALYGPVPPPAWWDGPEEEDWVDWWCRRRQLLQDDMPL